MSVRVPVLQGSVRGGLRRGCRPRDYRHHDLWWRRQVGHVCRERSTQVNRGGKVTTGEPSMRGVRWKILTLESVNFAKKRQKAKHHRLCLCALNINRIKAKQKSVLKGIVRPKTLDAGRTSNSSEDFAAPPHNILGPDNRNN